MALWSPICGLDLPIRHDRTPDLIQARDWIRASPFRNRLRFDQGNIQASIADQPATAELGRLLVRRPADRHDVAERLHLVVLGAKLG